jgi:TonB family protein
VSSSRIFVTVLLLASLCTASLAHASAQLIEAPSSRDEHVKLSEILIPLPASATAEEVASAEKEAEAIVDRLYAGSPFDQEARDHSKGPTAPQGGNLGYFAQGKLAPSLEAQVFSLKVGAITPPIRTRQGFVIIKVTDHVLGPPQNVDILSDTAGFDFGPYLSSALERIRKQWLAMMPHEAQAPLYKYGAVAIMFTIRKDGTLGSIKLALPSGDSKLDQAAGDAVTASNPLPALPSAFAKDSLTIRLRFFYNPDQVGRDVK